MSTVYLFESNAIVGILKYTGTALDIGAADFVMMVPDGLQVDSSTVTGTSTLETAILAAYAAYYPGFASNIGEIVSGNLFDPNLSSGGILQGGGYMALDDGALGSHGPFNGAWNLGSTPTTILLAWSVYEIVTTDPRDGPQVRTYVEHVPGDLTCEVSLDNGVGWNAVTSGQLFAVPPADQGSQFYLRFTNSSGSRLWVGGWTLLY